MPVRQAGRDVIAETVGGIDVESGAAGELDRIFGLKLVELSKSACLMSAIVISPLSRISMLYL